jgi:hypothetical protein
MRERRSVFTLIPNVVFGVDVADRLATFDVETEGTVPAMVSDDHFHVVFRRFEPEICAPAPSGLEVSGDLFLQRVELALHVRVRNGTGAIHDGDDRIHCLLPWQGEHAWRRVRRPIAGRRG